MAVFIMPVAVSLLVAFAPHPSYLQTATFGGWAEGNRQGHPGQGDERRIEAPLLLPSPVPIRSAHSSVSSDTEPELYIFFHRILRPFPLYLPFTLALFILTIHILLQSSFFIIILLVFYLCLS